MEAKKFIKATELLKYEGQANQAALDKIEDLFSLRSNPYWNSEKDGLKRSYCNTLCTIERCQEKYRIFNERVKSILKSKKVKDFVIDYQFWSSGYSMGESVEVVITDGIAKYTHYVSDFRKEYRGRAKRWNNKITYGSCILFCDIKSQKTKYEIKKIEK